MSQHRIAIVTNGIKLDYHVSGLEKGRQLEYRQYREYGNRTGVINFVCISGFENWCYNAMFPKRGD